MIHFDYSFLEEVASCFAAGDENVQQSDEEIVLTSLDASAHEKLTGLALRLVLSDRVGIPHECLPDLLSEAEHVFAPKKPKGVKPEAKTVGKEKSAAVKSTEKKDLARKKAA